MGNSEPTYENPNITDDKIISLENKIKDFIENQKKNIKECFNDKEYSEQNIDYTIDTRNNSIQKNEKLNCLKDFAIQWSIPGNYKVNSTKCHLTFFNIGALLGADGFLYSISFFYYYFMKIPIQNRDTNEIMRDIEIWLNHIDNSNIEELNSKWRVELNDDLLKNLKIVKYFLINLFQEKITENIFYKIVF